MDEVVPRVLSYRTRDLQTMFDPAAGEGAFIGPLRRKFYSTWMGAADLDPAVGPWEEANDSYEADFLETDWDAVFSGVKLDLIIGNPPYCVAVEFCRESIALSEAVIYLLRADFLGSADRARFFEEYRPSHVFLLPNRIPFYGPALRPPYTKKVKEHQTGEYNYAWICWSPLKDDQPTQLVWLPEVARDIRRPK